MTRGEEAEGHWLVLGDVLVDLQRGTLTLDANVERIPERERALLAGLAAAAPHDVSREDLGALVWGLLSPTAGWTTWCAGCGLGSATPHAAPASS